MQFLKKTKKKKNIWEKLLLFSTDFELTDIQKPISEILNKWNLSKTYIQTT